MATTRYAIRGTTLERHAAPCYAIHDLQGHRMNQLGVTASPDTHDRYVTSVVEKMREKSTWDYMSNVIFTLANVDNFDMLKGQAAVYCGDQYRSYHGTTIQIVQPLPDLRLAIPPNIGPTGITNYPTQSASCHYEHRLYIPLPGIGNGSRAPIRSMFERAGSPR
jgi:hypothetical protein